MSISRKASLSLLIVIVILGITGILIMLLLNIWGFWNTGQKNINNNESVSLVPPETPPLPPEPNVIHQRSGKIIDVNNNYLTVEFNIRNEAGKLSPVSTKVITESGTSIKQTLIPQTPPPPAEPGEEPKKLPEETIKLNDLKADDLVIVSSEENIKDKNEFTASVINLQIIN